MRFLKKSHKVSLIYWKRSEKYLWGDVINDVDSEEIAVLANHGNPLKRIIPTLKFAKMALSKLKRQMPECIYVQNLDMLFIAVVYRIIYNKKLKIVYEVADIHEILLQPQKNLIKKMVQYSLRFIERRLCKKIHLLVLTSEKYYEKYYGNFVKTDKYLYMPNVPERKIFNNYQHKNTGQFTVGFIGAVRFPKQIKMLIKACRECNVKLEIVGSFLDDKIEAYCKKNHVLCYGKYNYEEEIASLYARLDCVFSVYPVEDYNVNIALPNKLYESIVCELPIIVSKGTYLAEIVQKHGVGVAIDCNYLESYKVAIKKLRDDSKFYQKIMSNCSKIKDICYAEKYNELLGQRINQLEVEK